MNSCETMFTLVLGGADSGKSAVAEAIVNAQNMPKTYIATAQAFDLEMIEKIEKHRISRGKTWHLIECKTNLLSALQKAPKDSVILLDCITLWITNLMLENHDPRTRVAEIVNYISQNITQIVIVSNDVGGGITPDTAMGREFRKYQGQINQALALAAKDVILVTAGLPQVLKTSRPESPQ